MLLTFRPIDQWPDGWRDRLRARPTTPFRASYSDTLEVLDREARHLDTRSAVLQVDTEPGRGVRMDGQLRADAVVHHPGVILTLDTARHGVLVYRCDTFDGWGRHPGWQANLRAVALGLEALRKVDRYGIADAGQQYAGFGALPPARAMGGATMTAEEAATFLWSEAFADGPPDDDLVTLVTAEGIDRVYRLAVKAHHPDAGGDPATFRRLTEARDLLLR
jgi:hypothetical protein